MWGLIFSFDVKVVWLLFVVFVVWFAFGLLFGLCLVWFDDIGYLRGVCYVGCLFCFDVLV